MTTIDFRTDPLPLGATVSYRDTHADIPDMVWADACCYTVRGKRC